MSRMIDADALFAVVKGHHDLYKGAINPADKARRDECLQMMCDITDAPTIDAIPVEWLEDKELDYRTIGDKMFNNAFAVVIGEWQKEQEGQDSEGL